jgi:acetyl esterase/lipase
MHLPRPLVRVFSGPIYRLALNARTSPRIGRVLLDSSRFALRTPRGTVVRHITLGGRPCERTTVGASERPRAVLYLHGGGYTVGSARLFRAAAAHLARDAAAVVYNLDYRLAPEHRFPAAWLDATAAFRELVTVHGYDPARIAIAGDSAGGGLAVAAARTLTDEGLRPGALALLSPWTDPSNDTFEKRRDFVINRRWGSACAELYRDRDTDPHDPRYAPMHGSLAGLPPMLIHYGSMEMLRPEIVQFAQRAEAEGVEVTIVEQPRLWHSGHALAGTLRTATEAVQDAGSYLRARLDASTPAVQSAQTA